MNLGKTLFAQVMDFVPWTSFTRIVDRYGGNSGVRTLSCAGATACDGLCATDLARESARH